MVRGDRCRGLRSSDGGGRHGCTVLPARPRLRLLVDERTGVKGRCVVAGIDTTSGVDRQANTVSERNEKALLGTTHVGARVLLL